MDQLQEGVHYYIDELGRYVFTEKYHLERGYCCKSGCKHCPYGFEKKKYKSMHNHKSFTDKTGRVKKYHLLDDDKQTSFKGFIENLKHSSTFRAYFNKLLADTPFEAIFWEVMPITQVEMEKPFEFVVFDAPRLAKLRANSKAFEKYFDKDKTVVSFPNLRGDAHLVVPTPTTNHETYTHLTNFVRNAPAEQQDEFWKQVGHAYENALSDQYRWLSTSGLGVHWLHVRIDSVPKYYHFHPYKAG